jgi:anti-sigma B factor antagonist
MPMPDHAQGGLCAQVSRGARAVTITLSGEIDCTCLDAVRQALRDAGNDAGITIIDLSNVTFCDCAGIHFLISARKSAEAAGGELTVHRPSRTVRRVLELTGTLASLCPE